MTIGFLTNHHGAGPIDNEQRDRCWPQQSPRHATLAQSFDITTRRLVISVVIIRVAGDIDLLTAPWLEAEIARQLRSGARLLMLDLRNVSFLGGRGVRTLLAGREAARRSNTTLCLVYEAATVGRPLSVLGLTNLFHTSTDLSDGTLPEDLVLSDPERRQG
jgi:anti-sigma B factor antagonist